MHIDESWVSPLWKCSLSNLGVLLKKKSVPYSIEWAENTLFKKENLQI